MPPTIPTITGDSNVDLLVSTGYYSQPPVPSAESLALTDSVMTVWTNFAKYGNPSAAGIIDDWPVYTTASGAFVEISLRWPWVY